MVIWADPAKNDLRAIHDFIASDSKYYAKKVIQDIIDRTNIIEKYPMIGRKVPETDDEKRSGNIRLFIPDSIRNQIRENIRYRNYSWQTGFYVYPCIQT